MRRHADARSGGVPLAVGGGEIWGDMAVAAVRSDTVCGRCRYGKCNEESEDSTEQYRIVQYSTIVWWRQLSAVGAARSEGEPKSE